MNIWTSFAAAMMRES